MIQKINNHSERPNIGQKGRRRKREVKGRGRTKEEEDEEKEDLTVRGNMN